jgi:septal ring factor EnvC (AmiA/AmiB activator)
MSSSNLLNFFEMPKRIKNEYLQGIFSLNSIGTTYTYVNNKLNDIKKNVKNLSSDLLKINSKIDELTDLSENWDNKHQQDQKNLSNKINTEKSKLNEQTAEAVEPEDYEAKLELIKRSTELEDIKAKTEDKLKKIKKELNSLKSEIKVNKLLISKNAD